MNPPTNSGEYLIILNIPKNVGNQTSPFLQRKSQDVSSDLSLVRLSRQGSRKGSSYAVLRATQAGQGLGTAEG